MINQSNYFNFILKKINPELGYQLQAIDGLSFSIKDITNSLLKFNGIYYDS